MRALNRCVARFAIAVMRAAAQTKTPTDGYRRAFECSSGIEGSERADDRDTDRERERTEDKELAALTQPAELADEASAVGLLAARAAREARLARCLRESADLALHMNMNRLSGPRSLVRAEDYWVSAMVPVGEAYLPSDRSWCPWLVWRKQSRSEMTEP